MTELLNGYDTEGDVVTYLKVLSSIRVEGTTKTKKRARGNRYPRAEMSRHAG